MEMEITNEDYKLLQEMLGEEIRSQVNWLKTKKDPQYKLFNAGQVKAFEHVLDLLEVNEENREAVMGDHECGPLIHGGIASNG
ncbi:hypothetical protein [Ureibacillus sp. GCM10028918]|uniref:hypothetical protein n=1 Tax=Ureibacillus sp. GCM10028918 TaxID=3273429 RepID=UPI003612C7F4